VNNLVIVYQMKIMGEPSLLSTGLWFGIYIWLLLKLQDRVMEEKKV
jgi:hypothetical protein